MPAERPGHRRWLAEQTFDHPAQQLVLQEATAKEAEARLDRLGAALAEIVPTWSMAPVVAAYPAMRACITRRTIAWQSDCVVYG